MSKLKIIACDDLQDATNQRLKKIKDTVEFHLNNTLKDHIQDELDNVLINACYKHFDDLSLAWLVEEISREWLLDKLVNAGTISYRQDGKLLSSISNHFIDGLVDDWLTTHLQYAGYKIKRTNAQNYSDISTLAILLPQSDAKSEEKSSDLHAGTVSGLLKLSKQKQSKKVS